MLAFVRLHQVSILWLAVVFGGMASLRMLGVSDSRIVSLFWLLSFFVLVFEFFRGMRALGQIATSLERIEHILTKGPPSVPNPSASYTAT